jgi:sporulation protein YlmC with PRC-barrel domain
VDLDLRDTLGREVADSKGSVIGRTFDANFDDKNWILVSYQVRLYDDVAKEFELKKLFQDNNITLNTVHIQEIGEKITLKNSKDELLQSLENREAT